MLPFSSRRLLCAVIVCSMALAAPQSVSAQSVSRPAEVSGGYSYLRDPSHSVLAATAGDAGLPLGWTAGAALPLWQWTSLAGEVSGHYKRGATLDDDVRLSFQTAAIGIRAAAAVARLTEFAQVMAGAAQARGSAFGQTVTTNAFMMQAGGGVDYPLRSRLAARLQFDYRWIRGSDRGRTPAHQLRATAGVAWQLTR
jgi:hypothetical protein